MTKVAQMQHQFRIILQCPLLDRPEPFRSFGFEPLRMVVQIGENCEFDFTHDVVPKKKFYDHFSCNIPQIQSFFKLYNQIFADKP